MLLALVDADANFLYVDVGSQGAFNDATILRGSSLFRKMIAGRLNVPKPCPIEENGINVPFFFTGDGGFGLHQHLMKPYAGQ